MTCQLIVALEGDVLEVWEGHSALRVMIFPGHWFPGLPACLIPVDEPSIELCPIIYQPRQTEALSIYHLLSSIGKLLVPGPRVTGCTVLF
jgi:hypothetical protein